MSIHIIANGDAHQLGEDQKLLDLFSFGFDHWLVQKCPDDVLERIKAIDTSAIGRAQRNQLLHLCHEPGVVGSSRVDLQACKLEYSIVSPK